MNGRQLQQIYIANGLEGMQLKNLNDIRMCHGVVLKDIDGYSDLNDEDRKVFETFIIRFFNQWGLEARANLEPAEIKRVGSDLRFYWTETDDEEGRERYVNLYAEGRQWG